MKKKTEERAEFERIKKEKQIEKAKRKQGSKERKKLKRTNEDKKIEKQKQLRIKH